jgi:predicted phosphodiesterase
LKLTVRRDDVKKIFVVSDIHGHCTLLQKALERAGFDDANEDHLLICCGDYFDRHRKC